MTSKDIELIGTRIKNVRQKRGITQVELAEAVGCSNTYISYVEKGVKCMSLEMFVTVVQKLHASADEILQDCIDNTISVSNQEFAALIADCSTYEQRVLLGMLVDMKKTLRENRRLLRF